MNDDQVDVVLPCLDEAGALPGVLATLPERYRAIVVDNGSADGSAEIAAGLGAKVVHEPRRGYGAAVHTGLEAATADVVCFADADGSLDLAELPKLVDGLADAELTVGRRVPTGPGVWPWHARAGNVLISSLLRHKGLPVRDIAPLRAVRRQALLDLDVTDRAFGYPLELLIKASRAGWRVAEFDVSYRERAKGTKSKVSGSLRGTLRAARDFGRVLSR
ncbi:glycosyltransferase [Amycolatopsis sp. WAC 01416]|uniref:glycosyltransferase family 2 protein n=1 Tax=Amycolatopsis sp. WAC 01416 TaxID=2203196 RepID=UPI000F7A0D61|nr:glycosyltransferase family 2 protein [Amycolatopsis sp. WAC 01416]RSN31754.1 glycosyltransferase [Amycolatopsis sp. WAC 01416]